MDRRTRIHSRSRQFWRFPHDQPSSNKGRAWSHSMSKMALVLPSWPALPEQGEGAELLTFKMILTLATTSHGQDDSSAFITTSPPRAKERRRSTHSQDYSCCFLYACRIHINSLLLTALLTKPEVITTAVINLCNQIVSGFNSARHLPKYIDWTAPSGKCSATICPT